MSIFNYSNNKGIKWFRIFGYGISWKNLNKSKMTFSERNFLVSYFKFKQYLFTLLKP